MHGCGASLKTYFQKPFYLTRKNLEEKTSNFADISLIIRQSEVRNLLAARRDS